jgi:hypothetical protein
MTEGQWTMPANNDDRPVDKVGQDVDNVVIDGDKTTHVDKVVTNVDKSGQIVDNVTRFARSQVTCPLWVPPSLLYCRSRR